MNAMNNNFFLVKITDYAEELMKGKVFMQPLVYYRQRGYQEPTSALVGDCFDGLFGIYDYSNLPPNRELKNAVLKTLDKMPQMEGVENSVTYGGIGSSDDYLKMFCMYMLPYNNDYKTRLCFVIL